MLQVHLPAKLEPFDSIRLVELVIHVALLAHKSVRVWESGADNAFWDFGYPRNASGELLGDLRDEGLASITARKSLALRASSPAQTNR